MAVSSFLCLQEEIRPNGLVAMAGWHMDLVQNENRKMGVGAVSEISDHCQLCGMFMAHILQL